MVELLLDNDLRRSIQVDLDLDVAELLLLLVVACLALDDGHHGSLVPNVDLYLGQENDAA